MNKNTLFLTLFFIIGMLLRIWLASVAYNDQRFDFATYESLARDFLEGRMAIDCCTKNSGYSAFLAIVYFFFGFGNYGAVKMVQVILDLLSGILLFYTAKSAFSQNSANLTFVLYMLNPFTASYTGIILPEVVSLFYIAIIIFLLMRKMFASDFKIWLVIGIVYGVLVFTRTQFFYPMLLLILTLTWFSIRKGKRLLFVVAFILSFLIASSYSLYGFYQKYQVITFLPPYTLNSVIYGVFNRTGPFAEIPEEYIGDDPELQNLFIEFYNSPVANKSEVNHKYLNLFFNRLKGDWLLFLRNYIFSIGWIWDKRHLFYYQDPWYEVDHWPVKIGNLILLIFSLVGIVKFSLQKKINEKGKNILILSAILFATACFVYPLVSYESRHTISLYGLVILWASYGIIIVLERFIFARKK